MGKGAAQLNVLRAYLLLSEHTIRIAQAGVSRSLGCPHNGR